MFMVPWKITFVWETLEINHYLHRISCPPYSSIPFAVLFKKIFPPFCFFFPSPQYWMCIGQHTDLLAMGNHPDTKGSETHIKDDTEKQKLMSLRISLKCWHFMIKYILAHGLYNWIVLKIYSFKLVHMCAYMRYICWALSRSALLANFHIHPSSFFS